MKKLTYACGIPRSGSTLVGQIMRAVLPDWTVIVTHPAALERVGDYPIVCSFRDPRDVAASRYRVRISRGGEDVEGEIGLQAELHEMFKHYDAFLSMTGRNVAKVRYEYFWNRHDVLFDLFEDVFGVFVDKENRARISNDCSIETNLLRAAALPDFNACDERGIHGDHIATPAPGGWRDVLPAWAHETVERETQRYCDALGYE